MTDNISEVEREVNKHNVTIVSIITGENEKPSMLVTEGHKGDMRIISYQNSRLDCLEILHNALSWTLEELETIGKCDTTK